MKTPKTDSTRFVLPRGVSGSEPTNADTGTLSFDSTADKVRVKLSSGWTDLATGGGGPPTGPAGGDLNGTYPNPNVTQSAGLKTASTTVDVSASTAPSAGQVLVATSSTTATWQTLSTAPSGSAGGDLGGTYPNPTVTQARGLKSASTTVSVSAATAPSSGQALVATNGTTATWQSVILNGDSASGDLAGTYPGPTVTQARGLKSATTTVSVSAATAPSSGQALVATSGTAATWQTVILSGGTAGGDLAGTYPNPTVTQARGLRETAGPTTLAMGAVADGRFVFRSGSSVIGRVPADFTQQTAPNNLDKIILSDSGASDAVKYMTLGALCGNTPITGRPPTVDSWNLEARLWTDPDIANNGWTVTLLDSPYTTQTRAGLVDLTSSPSANTYRSTLAGGLLWLQFPDSSPAVLIVKATTSAAFTYKARAWHTDKSSTAASYITISDGVQRKANGVRTYYLGIENSTFFETLLVGNGAAGTFTIYTNGTALVGNPWDGGRFIDVPSAGGNNKGYILESGNSRVCLDPNSARANSITVGFAGVFLSPGSRRSLCFLDYIRRTPYQEGPGLGG